MASQAPAGPAAPPLSETLLFQQLRWRLWRNSLGLLLRRGQARVVGIIFCSLIVWVTLFIGSYMGLYELKHRWNFPMDSRIMRLVLDWMFIALTVLLIFSTGIILYSSLFSSAEASFLLSSPARADQIFAYKYQSAVAFSSWAFVLLGSPILISYGLIVEAPWYFYLVLPLFFVGFVLLPGSLGALICLLLVNFVPRRRKQMLAVLLAALAVPAAIWAYGWIHSAAELHMTREWIDELLSELSLLSGPYLPTHWMARGLQMAASDEPLRMAYDLSLVWANGLFLYLIAAWTASKLYRRGFNRLVTGGTLRKRYGGGWLDGPLSKSLFFLDPQTRLLIIKDFRTFRRDPAQWAQVLIFMGLAVLYFSNVRRFYDEDISRPFQNGISFINLTATAFLMCAYTGRFIFPMLSLEGRKFWILGLLPLQRERLLWGKFVFAVAGALLVAEFLALFSNLMLGMPWFIVMAHMATVAVLSLGLSGLSVGLGACMPNFRESDPSKIAVGFGGTLNLVAGFVLLAAVIGLSAAPWHLLLVVHQAPDGAADGVPIWIWLSSLLGLAIGLAAAIVPMRAGARALRGMEF